MAPSGRLKGSHGGRPFQVAFIRCVITVPFLLALSQVFLDGGPHTGALPPLALRAAAGTRPAVHNSAPNAKPFHGTPVPKWGWGEAPPYMKE